MEIPEPPKNLPSKIRDYLEKLRQAAMTAQPLKGKNTTVDVHAGKGTTINVSKK
jgi:hypothetical protein